MTRIIGPTGSRRRRRFLIVLPLTMLAALTLALVGSATNTTLNNFEIEGNLVSNGGEDWIGSQTGADSANAALKCTVGSCAPANVTDGSGQGTGELFRDDLKVDPDRTTFTQGDKENDFDATSVSCPVGQPCTSNVPYHVVSGSTPPNKDDLFDVVTNSFISGSQAELDLGMVRTNNNGSSHVDFELNRQDWTPGGTDGATCATDKTGITGFKCPKRTEGDLLISFEISPSSTTPPVEVNTRYFVWDLPGGTDANGHGRGNADCQGPLSGNENTCPWEEISAPSGTVLVTAVNGSDFAAAPWGSRNPDGSATSTYPAGGWFEAGLDLDALGFSPSCPGFGTASAKARSSGSSVTSALTDLAGPFPVNLNNCGKITIIKDTVPNGPQDFGYTTTGGLSPSTFSLDDDADATLSNTKAYEQVSPGNYSVTETLPVTGYALTGLSCVVNHSEAGDATTASPSLATATSTIHIGTLGEVTCTYTNTRQLGAIKISKDNGKGSGLQGATFSIKSGGTPIAGSPFTTGADGTVCVGNLAFGTYAVKEESAPAGYSIDDTTSHDVVVDNNANCSDNPYVGESISFSDTPLSKITVSFESLAAGNPTSADITCSTSDGSADANIGPVPLPEGTPRVLGNGTSSLIPGTYDCTVVIDP